MPAADFQCTLLSLPHLLKTTPDTIPAPIPYIDAPPQAISRLGAVIGEGDGLKVGFAWAGNPKHIFDKKRSLAFALLAPLLSLKGVRFFSLQIGAAVREASARITDLAPELTDFAQTAGAIANLDLVISVDTAVAHLAGAMGKPVWIMLPFVPDWRWQLERKDSPWYPTARLFRQKTRGDWGSVVSDIAIALGTLARREPDRQGSPPASMPAERSGLAIRKPSARPTPLSQSPSWLETLAMADEHRKAGRFDEADQLCREILKLNSARPRAFYLRARIAQDAGNRPAAIEFMRQAITANGHDVQLFCDLAEMFIVAGLLDEALAASRRALALEPRSPKALNALGTTFCARGDNEEAIFPLRRVIALAPDFVAAHMNLGLALRALGRLDDALEATNEAIRLSPNFPNAFYNRGAIHQEMGRLAEAKDDWKRTLVLNPAHKDARANLCCVDGLTLYYEQGQFDDAESHWKQAIALRPTDADAHTNLAFSYLLRGKLAEGFSHYEWRSSRKDIKHPPQLAPPWEGDDPSGKRLLIHTEQGLGDTIQFCRYLAILHERGAKLVLRAPRSLRSLIAHSMPWLDVQSDPKPPFDIQARLLSLPHLLKTTPETIPAPIPYLHAPPQAISRLGTVIGEADGLKIGLIWRGSPTHFRDSDRSVAFAALAPILAVKGVRFFSLQLGAAAREASASITDLALELADFAQTAGAIANLDLVISVDTAVAHLAGAMGKRVWIMLPFVPDWRWL
ncbi:MAG TPA: tetratricopeptide repeat protein, partial [Beijerinckiaceae bacterium]|nr:tetratricopeptide repeat protein [Beijerinckiaceae bacterium]